MPANTVCRVKLQRMMLHDAGGVGALGVAYGTHRAAPATRRISARASSANLRDFEIVGRLFSTS